MMRIATMALAIVGGCLALGSGGAEAQDVTADEARAIAKEAYIYGFPLVDKLSHQLRLLR